MNKLLKKVTKKFLYNISLLVLLLGCSIEMTSWAAPCCARNSATPILMVGDDQAQLSFGSSFANVVAEHDETIEDNIHPVYLSPGEINTVNTYRLEGAFLLSDRFQLGGSFSLAQHRVAEPDALDGANGPSSVDETNWGVGDTRVSLAYEAFPAWTYSAWKPQGFVFLVLTLPTGRSKYEFQSATLSDVTGNGDIASEKIF